MSHHSLALAVSTALCIHILIYALLGLWPAPQPDNIKKSIPVTLVSKAATSQSSTDSNRTQELQESLKPEVQTTSNSERKSALGNTVQPSPSSTQTTTSNEPTNLPNRTKFQQNRANTASIGNLFQSKKGEIKEELVIKSEPETYEMSEYEQLLLKHLLASKLYDKFNSFMLQTSTEDVSFQVELYLFANGAIRSAKIISKDQDLDIDQLVVTAAYNASPYPRPPENDGFGNFRYIVNMSYKKDHFVELP